MAKAILSLFTNPSIPQTVVRELVAAGFARDDINLIAEDLADKSISAPLPSRATVAQISAAVDSGPETGTHGNVYDALIRLGVPDQEARYLYDTMGRGGALIYVTGDEAMVDHGRTIIERHHAEMSDRCAILELRERGPGSAAESPLGEMVVRTETGERPEAAGSGIDLERAASSDIPSAPGIESYEADFRENFEATFGGCGYTYDQLEQAYHYGYTLATDSRSRDKDWMVIKEEAQRHWESSNRGAWEEFEGAVRYGWDRARGREQSVQVTV